MSRQRTPAFLYWHKPAAFIVAVLFVSLALMGTARAAGELDTSFGYQGKVLTDFTHRMDNAYDMVVQPDGKIVVVGLTHTDFTTWYDFGLARYNPDGSLDSSFGNGGKVATNFYLYDTAYGVALQPDGKIVVVGSTVAVSGSSQIDFAVARYNSNGTLDSTFGNGGKVTVDFVTAEDVAKAVVIQPDNKIVVGGMVGGLHPSVIDPDFGLLRLNSDGSLDTTFDGDGKVTTDIVGGFSHSYDDIAVLAFTPDGKIVAGGSASGGNGYFALTRYNSNGSLDTTFDTDGKTFVKPFGVDARARLQGMVIQPDGKIVAAGITSYDFSSDSIFGVARFDSNGSLDTTFGGDGSVFTPPHAGDETATDVALTAGGKIVVAGYTSTGSFTVARYLSNGNLDPVFGARGRLFTYLSGGTVPANAVAIQADGKILVAGHTTVGGTSDLSNFALLRYQANPTSQPIRSDFDGDGKSDISVFRPSTGVWYVLNSSNGAMRAQPFGTDGDIAAPGDYDGDGGGTDFAVFRPSNGNWYILNSSDGSFRAEHFGASGDVPVPADYDGDAKTDLAVFRPSNGTWYIQRSSDNGFQAQPFGIATDRLVPGYYDGDEKADIAVWRASSGRWYIMASSTNTLMLYDWGGSGDEPATGDFDADGKFDPTVFRPSTGYWYILQTANGSSRFVLFGASGDKPVPCDYNGDFIADLAMWHPSNGGWSFYFGPTVGFGTGGDVPVPAAYTP
jgi:uncharacterized delta-60 repeat protein